MTESGRTVYLLDPTADGKVSSASLAPGARGLEGLRWGLLNNQKPNAGAVLEVIRAVIEGRYSGADVRLWAKRVQSAAMPAEMLQEIVRSRDVLIHGVGD
ncbi:MAG: hypothetical protein HYY05_04375 [Chloroflexi bacterium]|nr:hypothetical protein [Chloroflexota bacterium]